MLPDMAARDAEQSAERQWLVPCWVRWLTAVDGLPLDNEKIKRVSWEDCNHSGVAYASLGWSLPQFL